jgi:predicted CoA-binding protein
MQTLRAAADEFLAQKRIAVAGVSRDTRQPANLIFRRLRDAGYDVFAVNPNAIDVEGVHSFNTVRSIPDGVDGVVIVTTPEVALDIVADCVKAGVPRVWLHRGMGPGSSSARAVSLCREHNIAVIPGGCPNMFGATSDPRHRAMRRLLTLTGKIPREMPGIDQAAVRSFPQAFYG